MPAAESLPVGDAPPVAPVPPAANDNASGAAVTSDAATPTATDAERVPAA